VRAREREREPLVQGLSFPGAGVFLDSFLQRRAAVIPAPTLLLAMGDIPPSQTVYVNNLNEKLKKEGKNKKKGDERGRERADGAGQTRGRARERIEKESRRASSTPKGAYVRVCCCT
jgi:hypothetical protein